MSHLNPKGALLPTTLKMTKISSKSQDHLGFSDVTGMELSQSEIWRTRLLSEDSVLIELWMAERKVGKICGSAKVFMLESFHRNRGHGTALLRRFVKELNTDVVIGKTQEHNKAMHQVFIKCEFTPLRTEDGWIVFEWQKQQKRQTTFPSLQTGEDHPL